MDPAPDHDVAAPGARQADARTAVRGGCRSGFAELMLDPLRRQPVVYRVAGDVDVVGGDGDERGHSRVQVPRASRSCKRRPEQARVTVVGPMAPRSSVRAGRRALLVAGGLYVALTVVYLLAVAPEVLTQRTHYNHFALLAEAWLDGRLDLGGPPPPHTGNNDFAQFGGRYFVSFPPFPAVLIAPVVALAGGAERVRDGQFFLWLAAVGPAVLYLALERLSRLRRSRRAEWENVALAALFGTGTVYWFTAEQGTVWFAAHVVGVGLCAIYLYASIDAERPLLAGVALGLGVATRTPLAFALPFFAVELWHRAKRQDDTAMVWRRGLTFAAPVAIVACALLWHNHARFDDPWEFGHRHLQIVWRERIEQWGLFSTHYLGKNLAVLLTGLPFLGSKSAPFQVGGHGLALWITSPFFVWALWPKRTTPTFWALAVSALAVAAPSLLYQNTGWIQFGYRFSNDFAPMLILMMAVGAQSLRAPFWVLAVVAFTVNAFGAFTFQRADYRRFYFLDSTQRTLHEPDVRPSVLQ